MAKEMRNTLVVKKKNKIKLENKPHSYHNLPIELGT